MRNFLENFKLARFSYLLHKLYIFILELQVKLLAVMLKLFGITDTTNAVNLHNRKVYQLGSIFVKHLSQMHKNVAVARSKRVIIDDVNRALAHSTMLPHK